MEQTKYLDKNVESLKFLISVPGIDEELAERVSKLLVLSRLRKYDAGEYIITEGENDSWLYFLLSGKVAIEKGEVELKIIDKPGELFGEMSVIDTKSRSASVRALDKVLCLAVDTCAAGRLCEGNRRADLLIYLFRTVAEYSSLRLRFANDAIIEEKQKNRKLMEQLEKS